MIQLTNSQEMNLPNKNYVKGVKKEQRICKKLREKLGYDIAQRSAGSHSPIDIFAINEKTRTILFVQAKPKSISDAKKQKLYDELNYLKGVWHVKFEVL